jgi:hypothetical protein
MATPPFRDDRDKPDWNMPSPAAIGAAGRVRTTDPKQCWTIDITQHTSVARKRKKKLEIRDALTENLDLASPKWTSSSWTPGSLNYARMIHGEEDA